MAPEQKKTKRKSADAVTSSAKRAKSEKSTTKPTTAGKKAVEDTKEAVVKYGAGRKRAADFFESADVAEDATAPAPEVKAPNPKRSKASSAISKTQDKNSSEPQAAMEVAKVQIDTEATSSDNEDLADQSAALLEGFDSSSEEDEAAGAITEIPEIPADQKLTKRLKAASDNASEGPGVVYVGRVPHGFYEHQMRAYFSQFGDITRLRLSRNKKTGQSKHYAFIEFASREVAKIVSATMDKYLLFGHILQVRLIAPEEVHKDLFKGANQRFKVVPRNKMQGRQLRLPQEREVWEKRIAKETKRRKQKEEKLKMLGYEFSGPKLTSTETIPFRKQPDVDAAQVNNGTEKEELQALSAPKAKKTKAKAKSSSTEIASEA